MSKYDIITSVHNSTRFYVGYRCEAYVLPQEPKYFNSMIRLNLLIGAAV